MHVTSLAEWKKLPEIVVPAIQSEATKGTVYAVQKVGFVLVSPNECSDADRRHALLQGGKYFFPTAIILFDGREQLCRLPPQLGDWAFTTVALAHQGHKMVPSDIEFGILRGRYYAEIL